MQKKKDRNNQKGFLLISSLFVLSIMMVIVSFYLNGIIQEIKVSEIINTTPATYYLAEAGIQEAFWKLQNDSSWKNNFETDQNWSGSFTRNNTLINNSSYIVTVQNIDYANAIITATSTISVRGIDAQRVVQASAFKAISNQIVEGNALVSNGDIEGIGSVIDIIGGGLSANGDIDLMLFSDWTTTKTAKAVNDVDITSSSSLTATEGVFDSNNPPIPLAILMPEIDFDSTATSSYKSLADQVYTANEFKKLLKDYPVTILDGITYVTGNIFIKKGDILTINGILVSDGSIKIGNGYSQNQEPASLTVVKTEREPSGLISKKNISIGGFSTNIDVDGLIYAGGDFIITDGILQNVNVSIEGAIIAQDIKILMSWDATVLTLNEQYIADTLGTPLFSQVLFINHWEEEY